MNLLEKFNFPIISRHSNVRGGKSRRRAASALGAVLLVCSGCLGGPTPSSPDTTTIETTTTNGTTTVDTTTDDSDGPNAPESPSKGDSDALADVLAEYLDAENRSAYAEDHRLQTRDGRVEVVVELEEGQQFPESYDVTVVASHDNLVQAYVAPADLRALAADENVSRVRTPTRPATDATTEGSA